MARKRDYVRVTLGNCDENDDTRRAAPAFLTPFARKFLQFSFKAHRLLSELEHLNCANSELFEALANLETRYAYKENRLPGESANATRKCRNCARLVKGNRLICAKVGGIRPCNR